MWLVTWLVPGQGSPAGMAEARAPWQGATAPAVRPGPSVGRATRPGCATAGSARAIAGVGLVDPREATVRHVEERGRHHVRLAAGVDGVVFVPGVLQEHLPGGVGVDPALAAGDPLAVEPDLTGLYGDHGGAWVRVPAREPGGLHRDLVDGDVVAPALVDLEGAPGLSAPDQHAGKPGRVGGACHRHRAHHEH